MIFWFLWPALTFIGVRNDECGGTKGDKFKVENTNIGISVALVSRGWRNYSYVYQGAFFRLL